MVNPNIHYGSRGDDFKEVVASVLRMANLKPKYVDMLTSPTSIKLYGQAFTGLTASNNENYELFELLGDKTGNKIISQYMVRRFPQIVHSRIAVALVSRLVGNYGAKQSFASIARDLGFLPFISAQKTRLNTDPPFWQRKYDKFKTLAFDEDGLLEDSLEAFLGVTEYILDQIRFGVGYAICYDILAPIFDKKEISLEYEDLYDDKTILKETFEQYNRNDHSFGIERYRIDESSQIEVDGVMRPVYKVAIEWRNFILGKAESTNKKEAEQAAAKLARAEMARRGYTKNIPDDYKLLGVKPVIQN